MASPATVLTSPSTVFDENPRSPNSWTARSFTTLQPSDSPSQALFPKHSQASLLLAARTDITRTIRPPREILALKQQTPQPSFLKRNLPLILPIALLHLSIIALTTLLVLIITAATSHPRNHIQPAYYIGALLSFAALFTAVIIIYTKHNERRHIHSLQGESPHAHPTSPTALNFRLNHPLPLPPPPLTSCNNIAISAWEGTLSRHPIRSIMAKRTIAPSNARDIEMQSLPAPHTQETHRDSGGTAGALQRFLDHEILRQEGIKRRISAWLMGVTVERGEIQETGRLVGGGKRRRRDSVEGEIERYLGFLPPGFLGEGDLYSGSRVEGGEGEEGRVDGWEGEVMGGWDVEVRGGKEVEVSGREGEVGWREGEVDVGGEIDYNRLPPAVPRPGARGRDPMLSDPITVVHVGPMRADARSGLRAELSAEGESAGSEGAVGGQEGGEEGERNDYAERWMRRVVAGVDVERVAGPAGRRKKGARRLRFW
ncbi:MAG: hypothetical protein Q9166_003246 [cf. Caloplaca sp. 2 TL-2023]